MRKTGHGGLRDQDRIFTNAYMRHDHGIKGAMVSGAIEQGGRVGRGAEVWVETRVALIGVETSNKLTVPATGV